MVEKGEALLASVHYPSVRDNMLRLQADYADLCGTAKVSRTHPGTPDVFATRLPPKS